MVTGGVRAVARCDELGVAPYSDAAEGLFRAYLTPAHRAAVDAVGTWMVEAGMDVRLDAAANLIGRYEGVIPGAPALMIGSHIDSVRDAGRYDGPLGIMLGIELVSTLQGRRLPFAIEVIAFGDEEGSRFPASMLCSRAVAGTLPADTISVADKTGSTLGDALRGFNPDYSVANVCNAIYSREPLGISTFLTAHRDPAAILAFVEPHIEQGPVLEAEGLAVGVVTGIAAQLRFEVTVAGTAGHAGTTAMPHRRDALPAAAEMVLAVERTAQEAGGDVVATVGRMTVAPGAVNVIPGRVAFSIDIRSGDPAARDVAATLIRQAIADIAHWRGLALTMEQVQDLPAAPCDPRLTDLMAAACADAGAPTLRLTSGAGHDTMVMAALCPTAMLFIRCAGGISHNPAESVTAADADTALRVLAAFVQRLEDTPIA